MISPASASLTRIWETSASCWLNCWVNVPGMCCTRTTAPGKSLGNCGTKLIGAAGPPVDAATSTMGNFPVLRAGAAAAAAPELVGRTCCSFCSTGWVASLAAGSLRGAAVAISCCNLERVAVLTTRTLEATLSLRYSSSLTELMSRSIPPPGLGTKSMAPSSSAFSVMSAPSRDSELTISTGRGLLDIMTSVACKPSMCGMLMSMLITSALTTSAWVTASRPSRASPHTSSCGSAAIMVCNTLRMKAESSTMSTRILLPFSIMSATFLSRCRRFRGRRSRSLPDQAGNGCNELVFLNWLCQKRPSALFHGAITMFRSGARRHHHDGNAARLRILPQMRKQLVAVRPWHLKIGDHQIAVHLCDDLQRFQAIRSKLHAIAGFLEHAANKLAHADGIVDQHNDLLLFAHVNAFRPDRTVGHSFSARGKNPRGVGAGHQWTTLNGFSGHQTVDVNQQDQAAVGRDGRSGKHFQIAQILAQTLDDDFVFADHILNDYSHQASGDIHDHQPVVVVGGLNGIEPKHGIETHDLCDYIAHLGKQLATDFFNVGLAQAAYLFHERQRQREHMIATTDEQGLRNNQRERDFQSEPAAVSFFRFNFNFAVELRQVGTDHVEPNSAAGQLGFARRSGAAGMENKIH